MTDRPAIMDAKLRRLGEMLADQQDLKAMDKANRPGQAPIKEVRACGGRCIRSVIGNNFGSVAAIEAQTKLPSERLEEEATS